MVESNKILTVSYGTFSCTLEGFDDSFSTMKAIAEYFRDLAAGDRYFGAEPPTPDADMLARIAEKEITRRVEARMESSGLVLRAMGAIGSEAAAPAAARPAMPPAAPARPAPVAQDQAQDDANMGSVYLDDGDDDAPQPNYSVSEVGATAPAVGDIDGPGASVLAATGPAMTSDASGEMPPNASAAALRPSRTIRVAPVVPAHPDSDSVAAKLQRIRAVVGKASTGVVADETSDYVEDLNVGSMTAQDDPADDAGILSRLAAEPVAAPSPAAPTRVARTNLPEDMNDTIDLSRYLENSDTIEIDDDAARLAAFDAVAGTGEDDIEADEIEPEEDLDDLPKASAELADSDLDSEDDYSDFDDEDEVDMPVAEPAPAPIRARVIRMKRAEFEAAVESGELEETPDEADMSSDNVAALDGIDDLEHFASVMENSILDHHEEAELLEDLAEVEREIAAAAPARPLGPLASDDDEDFDDEDFDDEDFDDEDSLFAEDEDEAAAAAQNKRSGRAILEREPEEEEGGLTRILSMTDAHLNEPESNRRRAAISQLKAAVAATEAARRMGEPKDHDEESENAFRDDLSQVVRPRRAAQSERRTERPRPAPLKLVASQRIDTPAAAPSAGPVTPVRPRRVSVEEAVIIASPSATPVVATDEAGSFSEFAENMGARDLGDLLEAAAAYTSFVEGMEDFSRPQLMKKVREAVSEDFSREDGLRSFGTLLRQGRIERMRNGRFQVSEQTRYRPEVRVARG